MYSIKIPAEAERESLIQNNSKGLHLHLLLLCFFSSFEATLHFHTLRKLIYVAPLFFILYVFSVPRFFICKAKSIYSLYFKIIDKILTFEFDIFILILVKKTYNYWKLTKMLLIIMFVVFKI